MSKHDEMAFSQVFWAPFQPFRYLPVLPSWHHWSQPHFLRLHPVNLPLVSSAFFLVSPWEQLRQLFARLLLGEVYE